LVAVIGLAIWGRVDVCPRGRIQAGNIEVHRTDFTVFTEAGAAFFDGRNPYRVTNPRGWFYLYPPLFALLVSPLSILDSQSQVGIWYAVSIALGFGCYYESRRLCRLLIAWNREQRSERRETAGPPYWIATSAGFAVLLPALDCLQRGQLGIALLYPLLLGFRLVLSGRSGLTWLLAGVVLAFPVVVKVVPALPVGFLVLQRWLHALGRRRAPSSVWQAGALSAGVACGGFLFVLAFPAACVGWRSNLNHLQTWVGKVAANSDVGQEAKFHIDSIRNQSFGNAAHLMAASFRGPDSDSSAGVHWLAIDRATAARRRDDHVTRWVVQAGRALVLIALLAAALAVYLRRDKAGEAAMYGLASLATLLISPLAWGHYYVMLLPAMLFVPLWLAGRDHAFAARAAATALAMLIWMHYVLMTWSGPIGLLGLGTTLWFLAVCVLGLVIRAPFPDGGANLTPGFRADTSHEVMGGVHQPLPVPQPHPSPRGGGRRFTDE
jgi:hypothetical protein